MKKYVLKRVITAIFTLLAITLILFILMQLMPGSPFNDEKLNESQKAALYAKYGLDKPIVVQFFRYVTNMFKGDLGVSYKISKNTPITQLIASRLPISIGVGFAAVFIGAIVGLFLGLLAAFKRDTAWDTLATVISVIGVSVPSYVFALALSYQFGFKLDLFPMLAESKGLSGSKLVFAHALRNALIPIITVLAPLVVDLMTGSLVVEKIFSIPGVGSLLVNAIQSNDYNVVIALSFIYSAMYIGIMLVVDILYGVIDPRIRVAKEGD